MRRKRRLTKITIEFFFFKNSFPNKNLPLGSESVRGSTVKNRNIIKDKPLGQRGHDPQEQKAMILKSICKQIDHQTKSVRRSTLTFEK